MAEPDFAVAPKGISLRARTERGNGGGGAELGRSADEAAVAGHGDGGRGQGARAQRIGQGPEADGGVVGEGGFAEVGDVAGRAGADDGRGLEREGVGGAVRGEHLVIGGRAAGDGSLVEDDDLAVLGRAGEGQLIHVVGDIDRLPVKAEAGVVDAVIYASGGFRDVEAIEIPVAVAAGGWVGVLGDGDIEEGLARQVFLEDDVEAAIGRIVEGTRVGDARAGVADAGEQGGKVHRSPDQGSGLRIVGQAQVDGLEDAVGSRRAVRVRRAEAAHLGHSFPARGRRTVVVFNGDAGAGGRTHGVTTAAGEGEDDRFGRLDCGIVAGRDGDSGGGQAGTDDQRGTERSVVRAAGGGAADGEVDGERGGGGTGAADGEDAGVGRGFGGNRVRGGYGHGGQRGVDGPVQRDVAGGAVETIDGDLVAGAGTGGEGDAALQTAGIIVAGDLGEGVDGSAGVHGQERVIGAAEGVKRDRAAGRGGPLPPDRLAARIAEMIRLAGLLGRAGVAARSGAAAPGEGEATGEIVVRRGGRGGDRDLHGVPAVAAVVAETGVGGRVVFHPQPVSARRGVERDVEGSHVHPDGAGGCEIPGV